MSEPRKKAVIVISSHVARGSVGSRAAVFALETLHFPVWTVPTVQLPWHPGHGRSTQIIPEEGAFQSFLADIAEAPWISEVGAVLTGYMARRSQIDAVAELINTLKNRDPSLHYLCDPVIGDQGELYVSPDIAGDIRDHLIPLCDTATPNRFELAWLCGEEPDGTLEATISQAKSLGPQTMLVTSSPATSPDLTGNLLCTSKDALIAEHQTVGKPPNGPGDLTSALFLANRLAGLSDQNNLEKTTASVFEVVQHASTEGLDELALERATASITGPEVKITAKPV